MKTEIFRMEKSGDVVYLKYKHLDKYSFVNHAVSTRHGGVSTLSGLESMNLGTQTRDSAENVTENYRIFCKAAGFTADKLVITKQTHSTNVRVATSEDAGKGYNRLRDYDNVDALVTNIKNLPIVVHSADCIPVSFIDINRKVAAVAHCGWRGTYGKISENTLRVMIDVFSTDPRDVVCTIGPGICRECYEVSFELYNNFINRFGMSDAFVHDGCKYFIDLVQVNSLTLQECGIKQENIIKSDICTCCNTDLLYSHRGQGPQRGIFATVVELV